jgi:hypothetical protein
VPWAGNYGAKIDATVQFDDRYEFTLGDTKFELMSTPGETPDHLTVWIPKYKAAFVGDNYYESFPEHVHVARHQAALGARLHRVAQQGARAEAGAAAAEPRRAGSRQRARSRDG